LHSISSFISVSMAFGSSTFSIFISIVM
jgi:hypothetical protein